MALLLSEAREMRVLDTKPIPLGGKVRRVNGEN